jgi:hypothetical protein
MATKQQTKAKRMANPWIKHVQVVKKENPKLTLREVLQKAKKSYKK